MQHLVLQIQPCSSLLEIFLDSREWLESVVLFAHMLLSGWLRWDFWWSYCLVLFNSSPPQCLPEKLIFFFFSCLSCFCFCFLTPTGFSVFWFPQFRENGIIDSFWLSLTLFITVVACRCDLWNSAGWCNLGLKFFIFLPKSLKCWRPKFEKLFELWNLA